MEIAAAATKSTITISWSDTETDTDEMPTSTGIFDANSVATGETVAALICVMAALLCLRCAKNPLYHSSASLWRGDRRFWYVMTAGLFVAAILEFIGGYVVVWVVWRNLLRSLDAHPTVVAYMFYAAMIIAAILGTLVLRWAVVGSARRNWLALIGAIIIAMAFFWRVYLMERQVFAQGVAQEIWFGAELHIIGVIVGAVSIAAIAWHYIGERRRQLHWRDNLTTSSQLIRHVGKRQQTRRQSKPSYRPRLRLSR